MEKDPLIIINGY